MTLAGRKASLVVAALIVSVCLNLLVAGLAVGRGWRHARPKWGPERAIAQLVETLPGPAQDAVRQRFAAGDAEIRPRMAALREARKRVAGLLGTPQASRQELADALADVRRRSTDVQEAVHGVLGQAASEMSADVRRQWQPRWWAVR